MKVAPKYPSVAANGPRYAADVVAMVGTTAGIRLDYSVASLAVVDRVIESIRREGPPATAVAGTLLGFGAYLGEVLVRSGHADWTDFDTAQRELFGHDFGVRTSDGRVWNTLGKALKRYENGHADSLRLFYLSVAGQAHL